MTSTISLAVRHALAVAAGCGNIAPLIVADAACTAQILVCSNLGFIYPQSSSTPHGVPNQASGTFSASVILFMVVETQQPWLAVVASSATATAAATNTIELSSNRPGGTKAGSSPRQVSASTPTGLGTLPNVVWAGPLRKDVVRLVCAMNGTEESLKAAMGLSSARNDASLSDKPPVNIGAVRRFSANVFVEDTTSASATTDTTDTTSRGAMETQVLVVSTYHPWQRGSSHRDADDASSESFLISQHVPPAGCTGLCWLTTLPASTVASGSDPAPCYIYVSALSPTSSLLELLLIEAVRQEIHVGVHHACRPPTQSLVWAAKPPTAGLSERRTSSASASASGSGSKLTVTKMKPSSSVYPTCTTTSTLLNVHQARHVCLFLGYALWRCQLERRDAHVRKQSSASSSQFASRVVTGDTDDDDDDADSDLDVLQMTSDFVLAETPKPAPLVRTLSHAQERARLRDSIDGLFTTFPMPLFEPLFILHDLLIDVVVPRIGLTFALPTTTVESEKNRDALSRNASVITTAATAAVDLIASPFSGSYSSSHLSGLPAGLHRIIGMKHTVVNLSTLTCLLTSRSILVFQPPTVTSSGGPSGGGGTSPNAAAAVKAEVERKGGTVLAPRKEDTKLSAPLCKSFFSTAEYPFIHRWPLSGLSSILIDSSSLRRAALVFEDPTDGSLEDGSEGDEDDRGRNSPQRGTAPRSASVNPKAVPGSAASSTNTRPEMEDDDDAMRGMILRGYRHRCLVLTFDDADERRTLIRRLCEGSERRSLNAHPGTEACIGKLPCLPIDFSSSLAKRTLLEGIFMAMPIPVISSVPRDPSIPLQIILPLPVVITGGMFSSSLRLTWEDSTASILSRRSVLSSTTRPSKARRDLLPDAPLASTDALLWRLMFQHTEVFIASISASSVPSSWFHLWHAKAQQTGTPTLQAFPFSDRPMGYMPSSMVAAVMLSCQVQPDSTLFGIDLFTPASDNDAAAIATMVAQEPNRRASVEVDARSRATTSSFISISSPPETPTRSASTKPTVRWPSTLRDISEPMAPGGGATVSIRMSLFAGFSTFMVVTRTLILPFSFPFACGDPSSRFAALFPAAGSVPSPRLGRKAAHGVSSRSTVGSSDGTTVGGTAGVRQHDAPAAALLDVAEKMVQCFLSTALLQSARYSPLGMSHFFGSALIRSVEVRSETITMMKSVLYGLLESALQSLNATTSLWFDPRSELGLGHGPVHPNWVGTDSSSRRPTAGASGGGASPLPLVDSFWFQVILASLLALQRLEQEHGCLNGPHAAASVMVHQAPSASPSPDRGPSPSPEGSPSPLRTPQRATVAAFPAASSSSNAATGKRSVTARRFLHVLPLQLLSLVSASQRRTSLPPEATAYVLSAALVLMARLEDAEIKRWQLTHPHERLDTAGNNAGTKMSFFKRQRTTAPAAVGPGGRPATIAPTEVWLVHHASATYWVDMVEQVQEELLAFAASCVVEDKSYDMSSSSRMAGAADANAGWSIGQVLQQRQFENQQDAIRRRRLSKEVQVEAETRDRSETEHALERSGGPGDDHDMQRSLSSCLLHPHRALPHSEDFVAAMPYPNGTVLTQFIHTLGPYVPYLLLSLVEASERKARSASRVRTLEMADSRNVGVQADRAPTLPDVQVCVLDTQSIYHHHHGQKTTDANSNLRPYQLVQKSAGADSGDGSMYLPSTQGALDVVTTTMPHPGVASAALNVSTVSRPVKVDSLAASLCLPPVDAPGGSSAAVLLRAEAAEDRVRDLEAQNQILKDRCMELLSARWAAQIRSACDALEAEEYHQRWKSIERVETQERLVLIQGLSQGIFEVTLRLCQRSMSWYEKEHRRLTLKSAK